MKKYIVIPEYRGLWNSVDNIDNDSLWIVTEDDIKMLAQEWDTSVEALMEQVEEYHPVTKVKISEEMVLEATNVISETNIDFTLHVKIIGGVTDLLLQPFIDEDGDVVSITSSDANDDSWLIDERFEDKIRVFMQVIHDSLFIDL
jgi:hypothetical protein